MDGSRISACDQEWPCDHFRASARFAASSPIIACDQKSCRYANVLNSGNEAIYKTNMRGQQRKAHYFAISKHAPSSRAIT